MYNLPFLLSSCSELSRNTAFSQIYFSFSFYYASYLLGEREGAEERASTRVSNLLEDIERILNVSLLASLVVAEAEQKNESLVLHS